jgi:outer membrane protein TolC
MKLKIFLLSLAVVAGAESFNDIIQKIPSSYLYKLSKNNVLLAKKALNAAKALNYGKVDLSYTAVHFFETPKMKITSPQPVAVNTLTNPPTLVYKEITSTLPMSDGNHFVGEIKYSYPIFTGFAITNSIKKEKIKLIQAKLKLQNTKRVLILNSAKLYSSIYALKAKLNALNFAKEALKSAKEKVTSLYKEGLVDKSQVDEIDAKYYEVLASIKDTKSKINTLNNTFDALLNTKVSVGGLDNVKLKKLNPANRPDVKEVAKNLQIAAVYEKLAKSSFYPKLGFEIALKKEADNTFLSKNDYQNIDKSYMALALEYNIFNGGADKEKLQMAKIQKLNALLFYKNYLNQAKTELKNDLDTLNALKYQLKAANSELKARKAYYEKIRAKFEEGLADSVDLNDAIAKLAEVKAKKEYIKSQIFYYTIKANLDGGN